MRGVSGDYDEEAKKKPSSLNLFSLCSDRDRGLALVGASHLDDTVGGAVYVTVEKRKRHPDYDSDSREYDFLLLKLGGWVSANVCR
jgi:hypothetical protein